MRCPRRYPGQSRPLGFLGRRSTVDGLGIGSTGCASKQEDNGSSLLLLPSHPLVFLLRAVPRHSVAVLGLA